MREIEINVTRPAKPKKVPAAPYDVVYPTHDEEEEGEPTLVTMQFFDGPTKKKSDNSWEDIAEWYNHDLVSVLWEMEKDWNNGKPFHIAPHKTTYQAHGNSDSRVRAEIIASEFADSNDDRWERKPLATRPTEWRYEGNRWLTGGTYLMQDPTSGEDVIRSDYSHFNIRAELVASEDGEAQGRIDPDLYHAGQAKRMQLKWPQHDDGVIKPLIYKGHFPGRKLGLKISDQSKSFAHYVNAGLAYGFDWIDGIYFCPFDTSNATDFKVTTQPSFDADEVSGKVIAAGGQYEIFLMPRRWLYRFRYRHQVNTFSDTHVTDFSGSSQTCQDSLSGAINEAYRCEYNDSTNNLTAYYSEVTHYECFFWGRWPCNWAALWVHEEDRQITESTVDVRFYDSSHSPVDTVSLISGETYDEAVSNYMAAGAGTEITEYLYTGDLSGNLHICSDTSDYYIKVGDSIYGYSPLCCVAHNAAGWPVGTYSGNGYSYVGFTPSPDSSEWGIKRLWQVIEESTIWTETVDPLRQNAIDQVDNASQASRLDMIPWGVGVSPSMIGDLVGIIRNRGRAWFVWRRTDEVITPWIVGSVQNPIRWESNQTNGQLGSFWEGDFIENLYDADFCDLWIGNETRKLTGVGRDITLEEGDPDSYCSELSRQFAVGDTEPGVTLHAPAWIMLSDEHALSDVDWTTTETGSNGQLGGRLSRVNAFQLLDADTRNAY